MPLDPSLSLQLQYPSQQQNPLGLVGQFANIQNELNQNRLFQQTFAARQRAGQILASAPDMETGISQLSADPLIAGSGLAGAIISPLREAQMFQAQYQGALQSQANEAVKAGGPLIGAGLLTNPSATGYASNKAAAMATVSPLVRDRVSNYYDNAVTALTPDASAGPPGSPGYIAAFGRNVAAAASALGTSPEAITRSFPGLTTVDQGNVRQPAVTTPALGSPFQPGVAGGSVTPAGGGFGVGSAAGYQGGPGNVPIPMPGVPAGGLPTAVPGSNPGSYPAPVGLLDQLNSPGPGGAPPPGLRSAPVPTIPTASDGHPLFDPSSMTSPRVGVNPAGLNILSSTQQSSASKLVDDYQGEGLKAYRNAQQTLGSLDYMDHSFDNMARGGGFLVPGTAASFRSDLAQAVNTISQMTGSAPPFDPTKIASIEDFNKETKRMGVMVTNLMLGQQREAAQTIMNLTQSVPAVSNTYMGGKLVLSGIKAAAQRVVDERQFDNAWQQQNQGNLTGADVEFNRQHPAEGYAQQVLNKFGFNPDGTWQSPEAIRGAVRGGYLTPAQAKTMAMQQFGGAPPPAGGQ